MFLMEKRGNSRRESGLMKTLRGKGPVAIGGAVPVNRSFVATGIIVVPSFHRLSGGRFVVQYSALAIIRTKFGSSKSFWCPSEV